MSGPELSIIVPVYNEEKHLEKLIRYLNQFSYGFSREFIFVDDCSADSSLEILKNQQKIFDFILISQPENRGKGAAIVEGVNRASGSFIMIQDADFELDVQDVPILMKPLLEDRADVVYGSRFKKSGEQVHRTYHYLCNRMLTTLSNFSSGLYLTDMETCYKLFRTDLLKSMQLRSQRFGIEVEMTAYVAKTAARVVELPIRYYPRNTQQGKKINWKDGIAALWHILRFNFWINPDQAFHNLPSSYQMDRS